MHQQAKNFLEYVRAAFPQHMRNARGLDIGSGDINGNNSYLFADCEYFGCDVYAAPNVTMVCKAAALPFVGGYFDVIVSSECFEHDPEYAASLKNAVRVLRPGGLLFFSCATTGRQEHGTRRTSPDQSWGTIGGVEGQAVGIMGGRTSLATGDLLLLRPEATARHTPLWPSPELLGAFRPTRGYSAPSGWWNWGSPALLLNIQINSEGEAVEKVLTATAEVGWLKVRQFQSIT